MANALSGPRFLTYARRQIADLDRELDAHRPQGHGCRCGHTLPCGQAAALHRLRDYYLGKIADFEAATTAANTKPQPVGTDPPRLRAARARVVLSGIGVLVRRCIRFPEGSTTP